MKENVLFSYAGKILRINLSNGEIKTEDTSKYAKEWLGASGIAIKILYDELKPWVTPYDPLNKLIFSAGTLMGTLAPGACKSNLSTLGPMTGGWASSCCDSHTGGELKYAGYDCVIIEGKARKPVYLFISNEKVEIKDASHLWGKNTGETLEMLRRELNDPSLHVVSIGPAGENLVRGACVVQDKGRAFGRCGTGAVMGSKNLKAIIAKGTGAIKVASPKLFMESVHKIRNMVKKAKSVERMKKYGTLGSLPSKQKTCGISYKNFQEVFIPEKIADVIDPCKTLDKYKVGNISFPGCAVGCGSRISITEGPYAGLQTECNQWEVFGTLQARLAIEEPTFMIKVNTLCNEMGLDVDAAGGAIGWAMECYQRGILSEKDTDGVALEWGNAELALELIRKISMREGFGNILAEGCAKAAQIIGRNSEYYAMHIKGQDLYEPGRADLGWLLGTTTSTRGGGHTTGVIIDARPGLAKEDEEKAKRIFGVDNPINHLDYEGRAKMVKYMEVVHRINNCFGVCHFNTIHWDFQMIDLPHLAELYSNATGWETSINDLKKMAMKQLNLEKAFNLRHTNFDRKDDMPVQREMLEAIPTGPLAGWKMDEKKYNKMLDEYYELHGWDKETSYPQRKTLVDLGLEYVADDLEKIGKLK
jgi:aldehyde:ferredoxin oxidoreductase